MRQIEINIVVVPTRNGMDGATASLVTIVLMEQCDESDSSYRLNCIKARDLKNNVLIPMQLFFMGVCHIRRISNFDIFKVPVP